jgi:Alginate lyase
MVVIVVGVGCSPSRTKSPVQPSGTSQATSATPSAVSSSPTAVASATPSPAVTPIDLHSWRLTLPVNRKGGRSGVAAQVSTGTLLSGFHDAYFIRDAATGSITFRAPSDGATTTPGVGSDHTRCELREIYTGPGADSQGNWTSAIGGTISATVVIASVSVASDEATVAQIHGQNDAFALLMYRPLKHDMALALYPTPGATVSDITSVLGGVDEGQQISYQLTYSGNTISVSVNGTSSVFAVDPTWAHEPVHFAAGAYHAAPHVGNPTGDATEVTYESLVVSH